jgi:hypothetical protein
MEKALPGLWGNVNVHPGGTVFLAAAALSMGPLEMNIEYVICDFAGKSWLIVNGM